MGETIKASAEHLATSPRCSSTPRAAAAAHAVRQDLFDLRALARSVGESLAGRAAAKGLQARGRISEKLPALVSGDAVRLRAALENLIDNAVKFTERGRRRAVGDAGAAAVNGKARRRLCGVRQRHRADVKEIQRLFRPFSQANVSIAARFGGAGLGLSSVKQLARAMGGDIMVAPRKGGGTTFTLMVTLPRAESREPRRADRWRGAWRRQRRCACSASRTIPTAAWCSTRS